LFEVHAVDEMQENTGKCKKMQENAIKCKKTQENSGKTSLIIHFSTCFNLTLTRVLFT
jgi:hypothetical protein